MAKQQLRIAFVRRGYSASGGAEAYLRRLARGLAEQGIYPGLITTPDWPDDAWQFGKLERIQAKTPVGFADEFRQLHLRRKRQVAFSLERLWGCQIYRAGDGVHVDWLQRRAATQSAWSRWAQRVNRKHAQILELERAMFRERGAQTVIANSEFVKRQIIARYDYPADQIRVIRNGVPVADFAGAGSRRAATRQRFNLRDDDVAVLFAGSGWERKGLRFATIAVEALQNPRVKLIVAGRGIHRKYRSPVAQFLGAVGDMAEVYAAADIFIAPTLYDPFSNACLEALACGLPVITTRDNGLSEIVEEGVNGSIVQHGSDVPALVAALREWLSPEKRDAARSRNLELAARYDISRNVAETLELIVQTAASAASDVGKMRNT